MGGTEKWHITRKGMPEVLLSLPGCKNRINQKEQEAQHRNGSE
jgi:hypothetical protein